MFDIVEATYEGGVFKPDVQLPLAECTRVRLVVEAESEDTAKRREQAWQELQQLWQSSRLNSEGDRLTRDELHERR
jgi:predicted DNA-binding antitoxin AbrB/MazE fold protein